MTGIPLTAKGSPVLCQETESVRTREGTGPAARKKDDPEKQGSKEGQGVQALTCQPSFPFLYMSSP